MDEEDPGNERPDEDTHRDVGHLQHHRQKQSTAGQLLCSLGKGV